MLSKTYDPDTSRNVESSIVDAMGFVNGFDKRKTEFPRPILVGPVSDPCSVDLYSAANEPRRIGTNGRKDLIGKAVT